MQRLIRSILAETDAIRACWAVRIATCGCLVLTRRRFFLQNCGLPKRASHDNGGVAEKGMWEAKL